MLRWKVRTNKLCELGSRKMKISGKRVSNNIVFPREPLTVFTNIVVNESGRMSTGYLDFCKGVFLVVTVIDEIRFSKPPG